MGSLNIPLIDETIDWLKNRTADQPEFNIAAYFGDPASHWCGTTCCIAGYVSALVDPDEAILFRCVWAMKKVRDL